MNKSGSAMAYEISSDSDAMRIKRVFKFKWTYLVLQPQNISSGILHFVEEVSVFLSKFEEHELTLNLDDLKVPSDWFYTVNEPIPS